MGIFDSLFKRKQSASNTISTPEPPKMEDLQLKEVINLKMPDEKLTEIGNIDPICPYCNNQFDKMPARKRKCPKCGNSIYVRTRPIDHKKVLIREDQVNIIEAEWSRHYSINKNYLHTSGYSEKFLIEYNERKKRLGHEPLLGDVHWALIQKESLENIKDNNWGLYRNTVLAQHDLLKDEGKLNEALERLLYVCYLDVNGPRNNGNYYKRAPFALDEAFIAPGIQTMLINERDNLSLANDNLKDMFFKTIKEPYPRMPLNLEKSWKAVEKGFLSDKN